MENNIFSSNFSTSNPFNMNGLYNSRGPVFDNSLQSSYAQLEQLRQQQLKQQQNSQSTVFTEITSELSNLTEDESNFIAQSKEYQAINSKYQTEFSQFLINKFSAEFLSSGNSRTPEELLNVIRKEKEHYRNKFADDINEIRDQNKNLMTKNNELIENNQALQEQLKQIQDRLGSI